MTHTHNINLNFLHNHQIHKEVLINENSVITDAMMFNGVSSITAAPDENAPVGTKYIINSSEANKNNQIAIRMDGFWKYIQPKTGMIFWISDESKLVVFSNDQWQTIGLIK
jgi:hypothetical protein